LDAESRWLLEDALPRGLRAEWATVEEIENLKYKPGDILLGKFNGQRLGYMDDKPMLTVASARAGKSSNAISNGVLHDPADPYLEALSHGPFPQG